MNIKSETSVDKNGSTIDYLLKFDELAVMLKSHLILEQEIDVVLRKILPKSIITLDWSFLQKVNLLDAMGFTNDSIAEYFRKFNTLRNKFAHKYNYQLSHEDIVFLGSIGKNEKMRIPDELKKIENLKNIALIVRIGGYLRGWLTGRTQFTKNQKGATSI